jgi:hypothetical protein
MEADYNTETDSDRTYRTETKGFDPILHLAENETFEGESGIHPMSQFRSYLIGILIVVAGISLAFENVLALIVTFGAIFLLYVSSLDSVARLAKTIFEALIGLYVILIISNAVANIGSTLSAISSAGAGATSGLVQVLSPSSAVSQFVPWLGTGISYLGGYALAAAGLTILSGILIIICSYYYTKGQRMYYTDRRLIITKRFGGSSTFQTTIDSISDVSSNTGLIGRLFGFGALYVTTSAGSGVYERDQEGRPRPGRALQRVKLTADGIKEADFIANEITKLRMQFMDSLHLKDIKNYVKKTAEALTGKSADEETPIVVANSAAQPTMISKKKKRQQQLETDQGT